MLCSSVDGLLAQSNVIEKKLHSLELVGDSPAQLTAEINYCPYSNVQGAKPSAADFTCFISYPPTTRIASTMMLLVQFRTHPLFLLKSFHSPAQPLTQAVLRGA